MKCVFFDRDGIVNRSPGPGYVERWEDFHLQDAFIEAARVAQSIGYACCIITNQRGIARGCMTAETVADIHTRLTAQLKEQGVELLSIEVCPHERGTCACRKPQPGMLQRVAERDGVDLAISWMVGDHETDIEAGCRAGCRTIRVHPDAADSAADIVIPDMGQLANTLRSCL